MHKDLRNGLTREALIRNDFLYGRDRRRNVPRGQEGRGPDTQGDDNEQHEPGYFSHGRSCFIKYIHSTMSPGSTPSAFDARVPQARARHALRWGHSALFMLMSFLRDSYAIRRSCEVSGEEHGAP